VGNWVADSRLAPLVERHGRKLVVDAARLAIDTARQRVLAGGAPPSLEDLERDLHRHLERLAAPPLRRVINGTGVVLHTNLGRAPLSAAAREAVEEALAGYVDVELDLDAGQRGQRDARVGALAAELSGAEAGTAVNNCAGATLLFLAALGRGREVIVARGELVEIGGGFRVPDIMAESGCRLVEVGTTNKVYPEDYARAVGPETAAILVVHRSNFAIVGFEHTPRPEEMVRVAREAGVPLLVDLGSGLLASDAELGRAAPSVGAERRPRDWIEAGADVVAFSGDKLLGGPQAGLLVGERGAIERCRRHPLARALRLDKLGLAALGATLLEYRGGRAERLPALRSMGQDLDTIAGRAERLRCALEPCFTGDEAPRVVPAASRPGGGALPTVEWPSRAVVLGSRGRGAEALAGRLRSARPAIVGRILDDRFALDARTIDDAEIPLVAREVRRATVDRATTNTTGAQG
jgi:L-seryl-tRNA(Ser) seleniumtransferase